MFSAWILVQPDALVWSNKQALWLRGKDSKKKNGEEGESGLSCDAEKEVEKNEVGEGKCTQMNEKY